MTQPELPQDDSDQAVRGLRNCFWLAVALWGPLILYVAWWFFLAPCLECAS